jgi:hypothetical protein
MINQGAGVLRGATVWRTHADAAQHDLHCARDVMFGRG